MQLENPNPGSVDNSSSRQRQAPHEQHIEISRCAEDLSRCKEELQQFAYVVSHDLQEPLRMVTSYLRLIE